MVRNTTEREIVVAIKSLTVEIERYEVTQGSLKVALDRWDGNRVQFKYEVLDHEGAVIASGDELQSGWTDRVDLVDGMRSLLSFLGAAGESYGRHGFDGENADLFSEAAVEWAHALNDELWMAHTELGEDES